MLKRFAIIKDAASRIAVAASETASHYRNEVIEQEPDFTCRLVAKIESVMNGYRRNGIQWSAKVLTDRGRGAQEKEFGADLLGVFSADLPEFSIRKGFLAQAKCLEPGQAMPSSERQRLNSQCQTMLKHSPASFVFLYSIEGVRVVPALSAANNKGIIDEVYGCGIQRFFANHFMSFIGDSNLILPTRNGLKDLRESVAARTAIELEVKGDRSE